MIRFACALLLALNLLGGSAQAATSAPAAPAAPAMTAQDLATFYDGLFPYALHRAGIPGGVIVVVKDGKLLFAKGYGYADLKTKRPVDPNTTLFRPGSVSKLFTWTAVMQLVQAGKIDLDADVNKYIDFTIPPFQGKPVTMRNLMTHSPGFEETVRDLLVDTKEQVLPIDVYLKRRLPDRIFPPGEVIAYSNYGATLAGYIVQRVSGEKFEDYIAKHIFEPLRMVHSTFVQPLPANLAPLMAIGYVNGEVKPFEFVDTAPAGSSTSTGIDMSHFMLAYLDGGTYDGYQLLKPATIKEMWTPQVPEEKGLPGFDLGFYEDDFNGLTIVGHGGDTVAFHSDLHLIPAKDVGFFVSFNSPGKEGAVEDVRNNLFKAFLNRYYPYTPPVESTVADPQKDAARVAGYYVSSRRVARALAFVYALGQSEVTANPDGTIEVSALKDAAGDPMKWREVGPLRYRQVNGQSHLVFGTDADGNVISWASDYVNMVSIEQRVQWPWNPRRAQDGNHALRRCHRALAADSSGSVDRAAQTEALARPQPRSEYHSRGRADRRHCLSRRPHRLADAPLERGGDPLTVASRQAHRTLPGRRDRDHRGARDDRRGGHSRNARARRLAGAPRRDRRRSRGAVRHLVVHPFAVREFRDELLAD